MADPPADVDESEFPPERTVADQGVPFELMAEPNTDPHALAQSAEFAAGFEVGRAKGERDGFERGRSAGRTESSDDAVAELRKVREDVVETVRALFVIFEIPHPDWEAAEEWIRRRLTPL
jgi:hypothetical protein